MNLTPPPTRAGGLGRGARSSLLRGHTRIRGAADRHQGRASPRRPPPAPPRRAALERPKVMLRRAACAVLVFLLTSISCIRPIRTSRSQDSAGDPQGACRTQARWSHSARPPCRSTNWSAPESRRTRHGSRQLTTCRICRRSEDVLDALLPRPASASSLVSALSRDPARPEALGRGGVKPRRDAGLGGPGLAPRPLGSDAAHSGHRVRGGPRGERGRRRARISGSTCCPHRRRGLESVHNDDGSVPEGRGRHTTILFLEAYAASRSAATVSSRARRLRARFQLGGTGPLRVEVGAPGLA